jgi:uncharacterized protein YndB with AHSA1/START domain
MTIRKSIKVARSPEVSFRVFCEQMSQWWPRGYGGEESRMFLEGRIGGRLYESRPDGTEYEIGRITVYQPPSVVAFTWRAPSWELTTQVEIRFIADGEATRVEFEHSGWDQSEALLEARKSHDSGWDFMLGHYQAYAVSA